MKYWAILVTLLLVLPAKSQTLELGKVSIPELEEKMHPADSSAPAAILFKKGRTHFTSLHVITELQFRIKVYNKDGFEYINQEDYVPVGLPGAFFSDVLTYNLADGKIEVTEPAHRKELNLTKKEMASNPIPFSNIKEGSIVEFRYTYSLPIEVGIIDWYFQYNIPVNYTEYKITTPDYLNYNRFVTGFINLEKTIPLKNGRLEEEVVFTARNVKAFKEEAYVTNSKNYKSALKHELASIYFPGGEVKHLSTDWITVAKLIYNAEPFGAELKRKSYFKKEIEQLLAGITDESQKIDVVFTFVQNRMRWDGGLSYFCDKGVEKAYKEGSGNVAEINLMLTAMLREAGLTANPVLVSTRENGLALYPSLMAFDYVIAGVETAKGIILLDATSKFSAPGIIPVRAINIIGRMIRKDGSSIEIDLTPGKKSVGGISVTASISPEGIMQGQLKEQSKDYVAYVLREKYAEHREDEYVNALESSYESVEIDNYHLTNSDDPSKILMQEFSFKDNGTCDVIGNKIYFNPLLFFAVKENPFIAETREYPLDFVFPFQNKYFISISLPEGYEVESLPKAQSLAVEGDIASFKYNIEHKAQTIQLSVIFEINKTYVSEDYYSLIRDFFQKMIEKQNEKVILKKV